MESNIRFNPRIYSQTQAMNILKKSSIIATGAALVSFCGYIAPAAATSITYVFTGEILDVNPQLSGTFTAGQILTGSYTVDSTTTLSTDNSPSYENTTTNLSGTIGNYTFTSSTSTITVANGTSDVYSLNSLAGDPGLSGGIVFNNGGEPRSLDSFFFQLEDPTGMVFSDTSLPTTLNLNSFSNSIFYLNFVDPAHDITDSSIVPSSGYSVSGKFTSFEVEVKVPEPFTVIGTLIGGTAAFRLRKKLKSTIKMQVNRPLELDS